MPKAIIIITKDTSLERFAQDIQDSIDQRFHNYQTTFPRYHTSEAEKGEIETNTAYANHAGGKHRADDLYDKNGVHLERRIG